ncbi:hypothetical protein D9757_008706 [Collybiopsis confluens]|uniref:Phytanoyl-CoA dioxygenase n=1 Tax=Collybiopsis confluens TaxID=2823264 RepID=A0A8H5M369_9AGAR|nr:hypothetical protein D9757_008706 [Collybiopsis confluens]
MTSIKETYDDQGFVVVPGLISPEEYPKLQKAAEAAIDRTRQGSWPYRRTVGKQFPPFTDDNPDSWGIQHLMHPELGQPASVFSDWYTSDALTSVCAELLQCSEEDLELELFNLLINPLSQSFALRWHRDDVKETAPPEEERAALDVWHNGVQWNTALYEDSCLYIVPGSHKVPRTPEQRVHSCTMDAPKNPMDMPGAVMLTLKPGETVFYNSNILHCAAYDHTVKRATLHACMGDAHYSAARGRNILQHGLSWVNEPRFREQLSPKGQRMLGKLLNLQKEIPAESIGYSLDG